MLDKLFSKRHWQILLVGRVALQNEFLRSILLRLYRVIKTKDLHLQKVFKEKVDKKINEKLVDEGYVSFPGFIDQQTVRDIKSSLKTMKVHCPEGGQNDFISLQEIDRAQCYVARYKESDLKSNKNIHSIIHNEFLLALAQEYLGVKPIIMSVNAWWSFSGRTEAVEAQNFHRDRDCLKWLKFFIYLTYVDENSGPHIYIKKTTKSNKFRRASYNRFSDESVYSEFGKENEVLFLGEAGDAFMEDTFGLHKGTVPLKNDRLLLQVQYGCQEDMYKGK